MSMMLAVNLMLCLFMLCVFGVLDRSLRYLSLRPAIGSLICLFTAGLLLLEDIPLTNALLANPGGFFVPMIGAAVLLANARPGTRRYLMIMAILNGVGAWLFNQITFSALEAILEYSVVLQGVFCLLFACLMDNQIKPVLLMSIVGFQLCDGLSYLFTVTGGQSAYMVLGDGMKAVAMIGLVIGSVTICRLRVHIMRVWNKHLKQSKVKPHTDAVQT